MSVDCTVDIPLVDLTVINAHFLANAAAFAGFRNKTLQARPRDVLQRIVHDVQHGCYSIESICIGGPIDYRTTCVVVISTALTSADLASRGFPWDDALQEPARGSLPSINLSAAVSEDLVRLDFVNCHWESSYNIIRGALHHGPLEKALSIIIDHIQQGCYRLESLFAVRTWCTIGIDTNLTQQQLRDKGFAWHGLELTSDEDVAKYGSIVMPGYSRAGDYYYDSAGIRHDGPTDDRKL